MTICKIGLATMPEPISVNEEQLRIGREQGCEACNQTVGAWVNLRICLNCGKGRVLRFVAKSGRIAALAGARPQPHARHRRGRCLDVRFRDRQDGRAGVPLGGLKAA